MSTQSHLNTESNLFLCSR